MFKSYFADVASKSRGLKVGGSYCSSNQRTHWWMPAMKEIVKLRKEAFQPFRLKVPKRAAVLVVAEANTRTWEEFGKAIDKDFQLGSRMFMYTIR